MRNFIIFPLIFIFIIACDNNKLEKGFSDSKTFCDDDSIAKSFEQLENCAANGNRNSQFDLAMLYLRGEQIEKNNNKALYWMEKSAEQGLSGAQNMMGWFYRTGTVVSQDDKKAFAWIKKSSESGSLNSTNNLGFYYQNGIGTERDEKKGFDLFYKAANAGNVDAQKNLGFAYLYGRGVSMDLNQASFWMKKAAERGDSDAMVNLAVIYQKMNHFEESIEWMNKSASLDNSTAQANLGYMYAIGDIVKKDKERSLLWLNKAMEKSDPYAYYLMGKLHSETNGIFPYDALLACRYFIKAAELGSVEGSEKAINCNKQDTPR